MQGAKSLNFYFEFEEQFLRDKYSHFICSGIVFTGHLGIVKISAGLYNIISKVSFAELFVVLSMLIHARRFFNFVICFLKNVFCSDQELKDGGNQIPRANQCSGS